MAADDRNLSEEEEVRRANRRTTLYSPGCLAIFLPAILILALILFGVLGGIAIWIVLPIAAAILLLAAIIWFLSRK